MTVVLASIVFFVGPAIVIPLVYHYPTAGIIAAPCPLIIGTVAAYVGWRIKAKQKAERRLAAAAQPMMPESRPKPTAQETPEEVCDEKDVCHSEKKVVELKEDISKVHQDGASPLALYTSV